MRLLCCAAAESRASNSKPSANSRHTTGGATRHVFITNAIRFSPSLLARRCPKENAQPPLGARSPATRRTLLGLFSPVQRRSLPALASSDPVTGPSLSSPTSPHTHTRTLTHRRGRAASLRAVRTPTARTAAPLTSVRWPGGTDWSRRVALQNRHANRCFSPPQPHMDNSWTSF